MKTTDALISIPSVTRDERIGSIFNELFYVIFDIEASDNDRLMLDLCDCKFFHPFFIGSLACYLHQNGKEYKIENATSSMTSYLETIGFIKPFIIKDSEDLEILKSKYRNKTYTPFCCFKPHGIDVNRVQSIIQEAILSQIKNKNGSADWRIRTALSYLTGEITDNILEHSQSPNVYLFSQYLPKEKAICLLIADEGVTLNGSYRSSEQYFDRPKPKDDLEALQWANLGRSTKNRPEAENRGYGINTTKRMLVNGLHGAYFMMSGNAFHRYESNKEVYISLPEAIKWSGTIVLMKIPVEAPTDFEYEQYIK